jgi:hypothetical protein
MSLQLIPGQTIILLFDEKYAKSYNLELLGYILKYTQDELQNKFTIDSISKI